MLRKIITTAALALGLSAAALAPANARGFGGFHGGGFGGFHGGGFHGGFGGFHHFGGGFHPGFGGGRFAFRDHDRFFRRGFVGLGVLGGLSYAGAYPYGDDYYDNSYDNGYYGYGGCYLQRELLWNGYRYVNQLVRVCQ